MNKYLKLYESHSQYVNPEVRPNVSYCIQEDEVHYNPRTWADAYFTIESIGDNNRIYYTYDSLTGFRKTISISTDNGQTWTQVTPFREINLRDESEDPATPFITLNAGERVLIKGENSTYATNSDYHSFHASGNFEVKGNIMSLVYGDQFRTANTLTGTYTFKKLLNWDPYLNVGCVVSAENLILPATSLSNYCYDSMFLSCRDLIKAPELPATTLAEYCYQGMFQGCTGLTIAPELPATTLAGWCYSNMFYGCTSLTIAPALSATTLAGWCYCQMFLGCTNLTTAPELPAATLTNNCYQSMFWECTNLTTAPVLLAETLVTACYTQMFYGCTNLNSITCLATDISATSCTHNWVSRVASSGTFTKAASMASWTTGSAGIPTGWTVETASE